MPVPQCSDEQKPLATYTYSKLHQNLLSLYKQMQYPGCIRGLCWGVTAKWAEACLIGQQQDFLNRLNFIEKIGFMLDKQPFSLKSLSTLKKRPMSEQLLALKLHVELWAFLDSVYVYHKPDTCQTFLHTASVTSSASRSDLPFVPQSSLSTITPLAASLATEQQGGIGWPFTDLRVLNRTEMSTYFTYLQQGLEQLSCWRYGFAFLVSAGSHVIGLHYHPQHNWSLFDINTGFISNIRSTDTLAAFILATLLPKPKQSTQRGSIDTRQCAIYLRLVSLPDHDPKLTQQLSKAVAQANTPTDHLKLDVFGNSLLHLAAENGHSDLVERLLQAGADPHHANRHGWTPLWNAAERGHLGLVQRLVAAGSNVNHIGRQKNATPLFVAAQNNHDSVVACLLKADADPNLAPDNGRSPLLLAAFNGSLSIVQHLVTHKANLHQVDRDGAFPLWVAAQNGHLEVVKCLHEAGADINQAGPSGRSALFMAVKDGHLAVVQYLISAGASANMANDKQRLPLWIAAYQGHLAVVKCLLKHTAKPDTPCADKMSPLWIAAYQGHTAIVRQLLEAGLDPTQPNHTGLSPAQIAVERGHTELAKLLQAAAERKLATASPAPSAARNPTLLKAC